MARRLVVQLQSDLDIQAAAVWYEDQQSGLGLRFLDELDVVSRRIVDNPRQFPCVDGNVHRALLRHFPYGVYFLAESEDLNVLAVASASTARYMEEPQLTTVPRPDPSW